MAILTLTFTFRFGHDSSPNRLWESNSAWVKIRVGNPLIYWNGFGVFGAWFWTKSWEGVRFRYGFEQRNNFVSFEIRIPDYHYKSRKTIKSQPTIQLFEVQTHVGNFWRYFVVFWRFIGPNIRQLSHLLRGLLIVRIIKSVRDLGIGQQEKRIFYFDLGQKRPTPSMVIRRPSKYGHKRNHVIIKMCDFKYDICLSTVIKTL